jgi:hypothetical protein
LVNEHIAADSSSSEEVNKIRQVRTHLLILRKKKHISFTPRNNDCTGKTPSSSSDNNEVLSALIIAAVESETYARGRAHRAGSRRDKAANRERFVAGRTLQIREDYFIGEDVLRVDSGHGKRYTEEEFERRFRMPRCLFNEILVVVSLVEYFQARSDATGKAGASCLQKVVTSLRQLCYGVSADGVEEYTGLSESSSRRALDEFLL